MLKVISNSTPIIALKRIENLNLLRELYDKIIVPYGVYEEVIIDTKKRELDDFIKNSGFIDIVRIENEGAKKFLDTSLHKGEVEVIVLAKEIKADLCIIDDLLARKYAKHHEIKITGTIGVLLKSKEKGLISEVRPLVDELINHGIYISEKLYKNILYIARELTESEI